MGNLELLEHVKAGDAERVQVLLQQPGVDVNLRWNDERRLTLLQIAAERGHVGVLEVLLKNKNVDVNSRDDNGRTALLSASGKGFTEAVQGILRWGRRVDINAAANGGTTCLHGAVQSCHPAVVEVLLDVVEIDRLKLLLAATTTERLTSLHMAASTGQLGIVRAIFETFGAYSLYDCFIGLEGNRELNSLLSLEDNRGLNSLICTFVASDGEKVSVCAPDVYLHRTILNDRASDKAKVKLQNLLKNRASDEAKVKLQNLLANPKDINGRTPLHLAVLALQVGIIEFLLSCKQVDVEAADSNGCTALHLAVQKVNHRAPNLLEPNSSERVLIQLLGSNRMQLARVMSSDAFFVPAKNLSTKRLLDFVSEEFKQGHESAVRNLVDFIEEIHRRYWGPFKIRRTNNGRSQIAVEPLFTLMHVAVLEGDLNLVKALALTTGSSRSFDINATDKSCQTPLHWATMTGNAETVKFLISQPMVRLDSKTNSNKSAIRLALEGAKQDVAVLLRERPDSQDYLDRVSREYDGYMNATNAIMIAAALIAGVAYGGWLQPPLGYDDKSHAKLEHFSVQLFWGFNSVSFFFSISTIIAGTCAVLPRRNTSIRMSLKICRRWIVLLTACIVVSTVCVLGAFTAAGFAALPSDWRFQRIMVTTVGVGLLPCMQALGLFLAILLLILRDWGYLLRKGMLADIFRGLHVVACTTVLCLIWTTKWFVPDFTFLFSYGWQHETVEVIWPEVDALEAVASTPTNGSFGKSSCHSVGVFLKKFL